MTSTTKRTAFDVGARVSHENAPKLRGTVVSVDDSVLVGTVVRWDETDETGAGAVSDALYEYRYGQVELTPVSEQARDLASRLIAAAEEIESHS
jgi:hypothetical protein